MLHKTDGISLTVFGSFLRTFAANYKKDDNVWVHCLQHAKSSNKGEITSVHKTEMSGFLEFCLLFLSNSFLDCNLFDDNNFNATYATVELSKERKHPCQAF